LPWVVLGIWAAPKEEAGMSSAEVVFGTQLVLPNQVLQQPEDSQGAQVDIPLRQRSCRLGKRSCSTARVSHARVCAAWGGGGAPNASV
jgi:hypothetical protein